jgi:hypothetical protein
MRYCTNFRKEANGNGTLHEVIDRRRDGLIVAVFGTLGYGNRSGSVCATNECRYLNGEFSPEGMRHWKQVRKDDQ